MVADPSSRCRRGCVDVHGGVADRQLHAGRNDLGGACGGFGAAAGFEAVADCGAELFRRSALPTRDLDAVLGLRDIDGAPVTAIEPSAEIPSETASMVVVRRRSRIQPSSPGVSPFDFKPSPPAVTDRGRRRWTK